jgi:hypothetical protein
VGNLCGEASLRKKFAGDFEGVLSAVTVDFRTDLTQASFDWVDMVFKQLAFLVNVSLEAEGQRQMFELELLPDIDMLLKRCNSTDAAQRATLERCLNLLSKVVKQPDAALAVSSMRHVVFKLVLYSSGQFKGELQMNAFRCLHAVFKTSDFGARAISELGLTTAVFDNLPKDLVTVFKDSYEREEPDWSAFVNTCAVTIATIEAFPDRIPEFNELVPAVIEVVKEKTEVIRKNAAVLLAKMAGNPETKEVIRKHHGMDVLISLRSAF